MMIYRCVVFNFIVQRAKDSGNCPLLLYIGRHRNGYPPHHRTGNLFESRAAPHILYPVAVVDEQIIKEQVVCVGIWDNTLETLIGADFVFCNRHIAYRSAGSK
jgi:hypothetical protein